MLFRRSPTKNEEYLQKYVKEEFGKEIALIVDVKTRWNSLLIMLERFYKLRHSIQKALIDLEQHNISFSEDDMQLLLSVINALSPFKLGVEALCRRDANLLTAEATFSFMLSVLDKQNTELAVKFRNALIHRISQRRTNLSQVLHYLHTGEQEESEFNDKLSRHGLIKIISKLVKRLLHSNQSNSDSSIHNSTILIEEDLVEDNCSKPNLTLKEQLQVSINDKLTSVTLAKSSSSLEQSIRKEMNFFERKSILKIKVSEALT